MRFQKHILTGLALLGSLSLLGTPALAADTSGNKSDSSISRSNRGDRNLGSVERANKLIGKEVENSNGDNIGKVDDLVVDLASGRVLYAVVSVGGFLGIGDRLAAVPPAAFSERGDRLFLDADKQKLTNAPEYKKGKDNVDQMQSPAFVSSAYKHFGQNAWWEGASAKAESRFENVHNASDLPGMAVRNVSNEKIGDVNNLIIDLPAGRVLFVILAPDRSQKLEHSLYALPPNALTLAQDKKALATGIDREKLAQAPGFDRSDWPDFSNPEFAGRIYQYYGKQAYFQMGGQLKPTSDRPATDSKDRIYHEPQKKD